MRKIIKTLLGIGGAFCLIGALLFSIGFTSGGTKYVHDTNLNSMNAQEDNKESANRFTLKKTEIPDFTSLNINLEDSDLNIEEAPNEKSYIEYAQATKDKKNPVSYSIENGTLTLKEAGNTGASYYINVDISFLQAALSSKNIEDYTKESSKYENYVTLYLPKDKLVSSAKIYLGYGDFYVKNATFDTTNINISLTSKDGDLTVNELTLSGKTKIALSYGDAEITLNDSTKKVSGFDLATHYGTITASGLNGNKTLDEDDDVNTFQSDSKDGKTKLSIDSKDGDITVK